MKTMPMRTCAHLKGLTLVEAMVTLAILGILVAVAVPWWQNHIANQRLAGISSGYNADIQWARSLAVQSNQTVYVQFNPTSACYAIFSGVKTACKCEASVTCGAGGELLKVSQLDPADGVTFVNKGLQSTVQIEPLRGMFTPTLTVEFTGSTGQQVRHVTNILGRTRVCTPGKAALGHAVC